MRTCVLLLLVLGCVCGAPVDQGLESGSCDDPAAVSAAHLALGKINLDRTEGYIFTLHRLSNVHMAKHEEVGVVYYLTLDVEETTCSVVSRKDWKECKARSTAEVPVYGQCKAAIFISKPHRVVRLYKYRCLVRPVPAARVIQICPDCPNLINFDNEEIQQTVSMSLEKYNNESNNNNRFALLHISRASVSMAMSMMYHVEYTIQETTCGKHTKGAEAEKCTLMTCGFAHLGFCKASHHHSPSGEQIFHVECEIYEPEASIREKALHLLGDATSHSHNDSHIHAPGEEHGHGHGHDHHPHGKEHGQGHGHGKGHGHDDKPGKGHGHGKGHEGHDHGHVHGGRNRTCSHGPNKTCSLGHGHRFGNRQPSPHDHIHDHTKDHTHHDDAHPSDSNHHHTHDHKPGSAYRHAHDHSHDHGMDGTHDHVHAYHAQAYDHSGDSPNHHHNYSHPKGMHTHEHDHEIALDHDHKHAHLHEHEHHHHHHTHDHEGEYHDEPEGMVKKVAALGQTITKPIFPELPPQPALLILKPDPQIPGVPEPGILGFQAFPDTASAACPPPAAGESLVQKLFAEDDLFKPGNHF